MREGPERPSAGRSLLRRVIRVSLLMLVAVAAVPVLLILGWIGILLWVQWFPPKPVYTLTVWNRGDCDVVGGHLSGDSLWRPVGSIKPGRATAFVFVGCGGRDDADYDLRLVRSDSSRVSVHVGWITGDWSLSSLSHDASVIPSDTATVCTLVVPMESQNELMDLLRSGRLIDYPAP